MTPAELAGAARLAQTVIDAERQGIRQTMTGGYVGTIARALVAVVAERDEHVRALACDGVAARMWLDGWDGMPKGGLALAVAGLRERDTAIARAERAEAELASEHHLHEMAVGYAARNQERAERAEAELAELVEKVAEFGAFSDGGDGRLGPVDSLTCVAQQIESLRGEIRLADEDCKRTQRELAFERGVVASISDPEAYTPGGIAASVATARARFAEEVAKWLDGRAAHHTRQLAALPATADERDEHGWAASYAEGWAGDIRAMGAKEPQR